MTVIKTLTTSLSALILLTSPASSAAVVSSSSTAPAGPAVTPAPLPSTWTPANNNLNCPFANATQWSCPSTGTTYGILCGWDTQSTTYTWGPYMGVTLQQCLNYCTAQPDCDIGTFTGPSTSATVSGTCYLKKSNRNQPFVMTPRGTDRLVINLGRAANDGII